MSESYPEASDLSKRWLAAGIALAKDPTSKIPCPNCSFKFLSVLDIPLKGTPKVDRYIHCTNCNKKNVITMIPDSVIK